MDRVIVNPVDVRGLGDIVSPKSSNNFFDYNSITVSSTDSTYGTVYTDSYRSGAKITLTADTVIGVDAESFTVSVGLKDHSNNTLNGATVHLVVNDVDTTATTSSGTASFTVTCDGSKKYRLKAYYIGSSNDGGCFANHTVYVADGDSLELWGTSSLIQTGNTIELIAQLTVTDIKGKVVTIPNQTINFYTAPRSDGVLFYDPTEYTKTYSSENNVRILDGSIFKGLTDFELSFKFKATGEARLLLGSMESMVATNPNNSVYMGVGSDLVAVGGNRYNSTSNLYGDTTISSNTYVDMKLVKDGDFLTFYLNGSEINVPSSRGDVTYVNWFSDYDDYTLGLVCWDSGTSVSVKNIKLKVLED